MLFRSKDVKLYCGTETIPSNVSADFYGKIKNNISNKIQSQFTPPPTPPPPTETVWVSLGDNQDGRWFGCNTLVDPVNPPVGFNTVWNDYKNAHTDNSGFVNKCCTIEYTRGDKKKRMFSKNN